MKQRIASDVAAPGVAASPVYAQAAGTFRCPESWFGNYVTFFGSGGFIRFGPSAVVVTALAQSADASGVLTEDVETGVPLETRLDVRIPEKATLPDQQLWFAVDVAWHAYRSSNT